MSMHTSSKKIIIVEDAPMVAMHLKFFVESLGHQVCGIFTSGEDLLLFLDKGTVPDIILMDIMLDGRLDGVETVQQFRLKYDFPVIFISALSDSITIDRVNSVNPKGHLIKPFNESQLQSLFYGLLGD